MADIDVVKKGSRVWLWILMLVVLAVILWLVMGGMSADRTSSMEQRGEPRHVAPLASAAASAESSLIHVTVNHLARA